MKSATADRTSAWTGLALAAIAAVWWLSSTRLALDSGRDAGQSAADVLRALWCSRGIAVAVIAARVALIHGWRGGFAAGLAAILPAWPVVFLAWAASDVRSASVILAECLLLVASVGVPLIGVGLRRLSGRSDGALIAATGLSAAIAALVWIVPASWSMLLR